MLLNLKLALLRKGVRQTRMAVDPGWDPAKLSRIMNETLNPTERERNAISRYLRMSQSELFSGHEPRPQTSPSMPTPEIGDVAPIALRSSVASSKAEPAEYMTRTEAATYLRVSSAHVSNLAHGKVPGMPCLRFCAAGRRLIFKRTWLDEFVEAAASKDRPR